MSHISFDKVIKRLGKILVAIGVFGAATALLDLVSLYFRAEYLSSSTHSTMHLIVSEFGMDKYIILNQATFAPLILSGLAFLRNWRAKAIIVAISFFLGVIPVICLPFIIHHVVTFDGLLQYFLQNSPFNYGSIFVLLFITVVSFAFVFAFSLKKQRLKQQQQSKRNLP